MILPVGILIFILALAVIAVVIGLFAKADGEDDIAGGFFVCAAVIGVILFVTSFVSTSPFTGKVKSVGRDTVVVEIRDVPVAVRATETTLAVGDEVTVETDDGEWKITSFTHTEEVK